MEWIEHIITISSWHDKIIVTTWIHWDMYAATIGTASAALWLINHCPVIIF
jgi:hypothetical protein